MENLSHSLSKKICNGNVVNNGFPPTKSVYDDVFGGPPKFGVPTFSPRVEDYSEIFGGFHASRGSSIPVLDLPLVDDETEIFFDVRSSNFDYSEVFGGFDGLDFSVSCEEFFDEAHGEVESFEEAWTLAETESMSEESDPYAHSGKSHSFSNEDSHQSCDGIEELHVSYLNVNLKSKDDMPNGACITQLHAVPGFAFVVDDEITPLQRTENRNPSLQLTDDINLDMGLIERNIGGGKHLRKTMSYTPSSIAGMHTLGKDAKCQRSYSQNGSHPNGMFLNVSEISLRTDPSQLPPPSRPPPLKNGDSTTGDSSPPYFDVEVDASSSAAASAAAMKEAMEQAQAKLKSAKELMERKKEGLQSRAKLGSKSDIKDNKGKATKVVDGMNNLVGEERQKVIKTTLGVPYSVEGDEFFDVVEKTTGKMLGTERCPAKEFCQNEAAGEWIEANEFFELVKTDKFSKVLEQANSGKIQVENMKAQERLCKEKKTAMQAFERQEDNPKKNNAVRESCEQVENEKKLKAAKEARNQEHDKRMNEDPEFYKQKEDQKQFKLAYEQGEIEKNLASVDMWKEYDISIKNQREMDEVDIKEGVKQKENDQKRKDSNERMENDNSLKEARERRENDKRFKETFEQEEYKRLCEVFELAEIAERLKQGIEKEEKEKWLKEDYDQEQIEKKQKEAHEREENERRLKEALEREENEKRLKEASERKKNEKKRKEAHEREENERRLKEALEREESEKRLKEASERKKNEKKRKEAHEREENERRLKEALEREESEKRLKEASERKKNEKKQKEAHEREENKKRLKEALEREENEKRIKEAIEKEANERKKREALEQEENEKRIKEAIEKEANERKQKEALEREENEKRIKEAIEKEADERKQKEAREREEYEKRLREAWEREEDERRLRQACEREENEKRLKETQRREENEKRTKEVVEQDKIEQRSRQAFKWEESKKSVNDAVEGVELEGAHKAYEDTMQDENAKLLKQAQGTRVQMEVDNLKASDGVCKLDGKKNLRAAEVAFEHEMEATQEISSEEKNENISTELKHGESIVVEAVEKTFARVANRSKASGMVQGDIQPEEIGIRGRDATSLLLLDETLKKSGEAVTGTEQTGVEENIKVFQMPSDPKHTEERHTREWGERGKNIGQAQVAVDHKLNKDKYRLTQMVNEGVGNGRTGGGAPLSVLGKKGRTQKPAQHVNTGQSTGRKEKIVYETFKLEERERELEQDRLRKVEEEREREREREKDRMAVERATREVRARAYAEVRDRAERAAVERATTDARQRAITEARERLEKACAEAREKSLTEKASVEARIRAERAAVERATAEARERAVEKAMSEKASFEARERAERSASSSGSRYPYSSIYATSNEGESAQRCKARLERHQRTAERAAKALAEKNIRDLLAQREQAERNRLAESLDADVKRWSSGKEGNLRALLSTLQYILGPDSGWYPIPLTEVITAAAVKKAYRKATLCVHPDKLQQRRASIQQKYICEKVFDLLKEAWNKFNSEER